MITLPPRTDGSKPLVLDTNALRTAVVVGANGSGKTRFTDRMCHDLGNKAFRLNVVDALYAERTANAERSDIDRIYAASAVSAFDKERTQTELDRLLAMLMSEELVQLMAYKFQRYGADGEKEDHGLPQTRLDRLIEFWQHVFPGNSVLVDAGKLRFTRNDTPDTFAATRLSDGERAVLFYGIAMLYAPQDAVIVVDTPEMFMHPATMQSVWNRLEAMRKDCTIVYTTHDLEFAASRRNTAYVWVRGFDMGAGTWDYEIIPDESGLTNEVYLAIVGQRKPVLFIEGDDRSIDARLYPIIFPEYTVKSLGSCNKVIEATRTFNDLNGFHHMRAAGIVDRDRRDDGEVQYLRGKNIMVPDVAEIENMLLLPEVIKAVAASRNVDGIRTAAKVKKSVMAMFRNDLRQQALMHTRHRVKRTLEYRIDGRFKDIGALESHIYDLAREINPRALYEQFCRDFHGYLDNDDFASVLRVYNQKSMLPGCNVATLCGFNNKNEYIASVLTVLAKDTPQAEAARQQIRRALRADKLS
ncbi:MAG: DUF4435 domain-containing protein [Muribaculaceae bacterium]|nr:DUF4435 domain-containing protein [Muribaculaceae bacterium]